MGLFDLFRGRKPAPQPEPTPEPAPEPPKKFRALESFPDRLPGSGLQLSRSRRVPVVDVDPETVGDFSRFAEPIGFTKKPGKIFEVSLGGVLVGRIENPDAYTFVRDAVKPGEEWRAQVVGYDAERRIMHVALARYEDLLGKLAHCEPEKLTVTDHDAAASVEVGDILAVVADDGACEFYHGPEMIGTMRGWKHGGRAIVLRKTERNEKVSIGFRMIEYDERW